MDHKTEKQQHKHHHHILTDKTVFVVGGALLFLTVITVWVAGIDLGHLNFVVAMLVASIKASLVALFFMNLKYDRRENGVIFATSFVFLAIFLVLTASDSLFRGDVYVKGPIMAPAQAKSKLKEPWNTSPELVSKGRELYQQQCVACHGAEGKGDGPAAAALNPRPRNFTSTAGWKNGRKPSQVFKTLKQGIPGSSMASYATLSADDRWALVHFVDSLGPKPEADTPADLEKIGITPGKEGGAQEEKTIPIEVAMEQLAQPEAKGAKVYHPGLPGPKKAAGGAGMRIYQENCVQCHGAKGEGGYKVANMGVNPIAYVTTRSFSKLEGMHSSEQFSKAVARGLPGTLMPGLGDLGTGEMRDLYDYVRGLPGSR